MRVHKCDHRGQRRVSYEGDVLSRDGGRITLRAIWTLPTRTLPYVTLEQGDVFVETFYTDRWYNLFEIRHHHGELKGWYADITRPARMTDDDIEWDDLALDIWMAPDGTMLTLDEDEFETLIRTLPPNEAASARGAVALVRDELRRQWRRYANDWIADALTRRNWTLGTAESCTGGQIGDVITDRPGSSAYFTGGIIAYSNAIKQHLLGVNEATLRQRGAVSAECALEMAQGVRRTLSVDVGVSATGIAGPSGGSVDKPVGLTYVAVSSPLGEQVERNVWAQDRIGNKQATGDAALRLLMRHLGADLAASADVRAAPLRSI
ncbi:MAG: nicotinamide-nucleotide amidohydrolase family protein [Thermoflexales bacterium]|nr:nicotinamide-nucleotide amidohydrolase family protein [Thermoflexales bacterium]